ncbi:MAG: hypothetical protein U0531_22590 [Dehalococcoidia bacterium]
MSTEFDAEFDKRRHEFETTFAAKHQRLAEMTLVLSRSLAESRRRGWATHASLWNPALYLNIAAHDLSVLVLQVCAEREDWARRLAARHLALLLYETVEDLRQLLGKPLRQPLEELGLLAALDADLRATREPLEVFWREHAADLKILRTTASAHHDHDGLALLDAIQGIDIDAVITLGLALGRIQNDALGPLLQRIISETASLQPPELAPEVPFSTAGADRED